MTEATRARLQLRIKAVMPELVALEDELIAAFDVTDEDEVVVHIADAQRSVMNLRADLRALRAQLQD